MGQLLDIGTTAGKAAPGEYSPSALLASRGQIIVCNSAGVPVALARGAAGTFLGSDGSDTLARTPPGYLIGRDDGGAATPLNTTGETSILNSTMAGALPAFVALGDDAHLNCWGHAVFGATGTLTLNVYAGATKIAAVTSTNFSAGAARGWEINIWIHLLSTTTVGVSGLFVPKGATGTGWAAAGDVDGGGSDLGDAITVSTLPLAIDIKAVCSTATSTTQVSCKGARVRYFPRNY